MNWKPRSWGFEMLSVPWHALLFGVCLGAFLFVVQERISAPQWDGLIYANVARDPWQALFVTGLTAHSVERVIPSIVVHGILRLFHSEPTDAHIILAFAGMHVIQLGLMSFYFVKATVKLGASGRASGIALLLFLTNFFVLKNVFIYPTLTDASALLLGTALLYYYLAGQSWGVLGVGLLGIATWPTIYWAAIPLLLFPRTERLEGRQLVRLQFGRRWKLLLAIAFSLAAAFPFFFKQAIADFVKRVPSQVGFASITYIPRLLPIAWLFALLYVTMALIMIWNGRELWRSSAWRWKTAVRQLPLVGLLVLVHKAWSSLALAGAYGHTLGIMDVLHYTLVLSFAKPAIFFVAHVGFFGIVWVTMAGAWDRICADVRACGAGLVLALSASVVLSLNCESRYLLGSFPLIAPFLAKMFDHPGLTPKRAWLLVLINLVASKAYVPMTEWDPKEQAWQLSNWYLQNQGPWMSNKGWLVHVCLTACLIPAIRVLLPKQHAAPQTEGATLDIGVEQLRRDGR